MSQVSKKKRCFRMQDEYTRVRDYEKDGSVARKALTEVAVSFQSLTYSLS